MNNKSGVMPHSYVRMGVVKVISLLFLNYTILLKTIFIE